jgi:L-ascorbate metabolism protein UlaG (beta-lactamase superfamily)
MEWQVRITMIGHSTVLLEIGGRRILTDPYFGAWGNPAYGRPTPPARTREELRAVDVVLISHSHWDHTDSRFLRALSDDVPVVTSKRTKWLVELQGARHVVGLRTWEEMRIGDLVVTAVPALHIAVAVGFVIRGDGKCVYFAGDTYHRPFMKEVGHRFAIDAALLPVTTYRVPMTMGERSAVRAVRDLKPSVVLPIHEGLRPRSPLLRTGQTPERFKQRLLEAGAPVEVVILKEGESWTR